MAKYVETKKNTYADHLSRLKYKQFRQLARKENRRFDNAPTKLPSELTPIEKLWIP